MTVRKSVAALTPDEKRAFVNAVLELKRTGVYDRYVNDPAYGGPDWRLLESVENGYEEDWNFSYDMLQL